MIKKIFVSYPSTQLPFAEKIKTDLEKNGFEVSIDKTVLRHSVIWTQDLTKAIVKNDCVLLLWSAAAAASNFVRKEIITARVLLKPIIPFLIEGEKSFHTLHLEIAFLQGVVRDTYTDSFQELLNRLADPEFENIKYPISHTKLYIPQKRNNYFVGRQTDLVKLFVDLCGFMGNAAEREHNYPCAITGLAGMGKTELASEFAYRFSILFSKGIFWIDADKEDLSSEFIKLAPYLNLQPLTEESNFDFAKRILDHLRNLSKSLLILDGLSSVEAFKKWCPTGGRSCAVLVTTRLLLQDGGIQLLQLKELDENSALQLLASRRQDILQNPVELDATKKICKIIGNLPLALELFASHLATIKALTAQSFLQQLEQVSSMAPQKQTDRADYAFFKERQVLFSLFNLIYEKLERAQIDPYFFLLSSFAIESSVKYDFVENAFGDPAACSWVVRRLSEISLISFDRNNRIILHPLVITFARGLQDAVTRKEYKKKFVETMANFAQSHDELSDVLSEVSHIEYGIKVAEDNGFLPELKILSLHYAKYLGIRCDFNRQLAYLEKCLTLSGKEAAPNPLEIAALKVDIGRVMKIKGDFRNAEKHFQDAVAIYEQELGADHAEVANSLNELGSICHELGEYKQALSHFKKAYVINKKDYSEQMPQMTSILQAEAKTHFQLGDYNRAKSEFDKVLYLRQLYFSTNYKNEQEVALSHLDLSDFYLKKADYKNALKSLQRAFRILRKTVGKEHVEMAKIYERLGRFNIERIKPGKALNYLKKSLHINQKFFAESHPTIANLFLQIGKVHRLKAEFEKALESIKTAIQIREALYGLEHPAVAEALEILSDIYLHQFRLDDLKKTLDQVRNIREQLYGLNHPTLGNVLLKIGSYYLQKGEYDHAIDNFQHALTIYSTTIGDRHPDYVEALINLAYGHYLKNDYKRSFELLQETQKLIQMLFGNTPHSLTARMLLGFSEVYRRLGQFDQALEKIEASLEMKKNIYGNFHPSVAEALEVLVSIYYHQYQFGKYKPTLDQILKIREKAYGKQHPFVGKALHDLGSYYLRRGDYDEAIEYFNKALEISRAAVGEKHQEFIERSINLADAYYQKNDYKAALIQLEKTHSIARQVFDDNPHPLAARLLLVFSEVYRRLGQFEKALRYAGDSLAMKKIIYKNESHPSLADAFEVQVRVYYHQCKFDEYESLLEQILTIRKDAYGKRHPLVGNTLHDFGSYYLRKGAYDKAIAYFQEALIISRSVFGDKHPEVVERTINLSNGYFQKSDYNKALSLLRDAEVVLGESQHPLAARMMLGFSEVNRRLGYFDSALEYIEKSKAMKTKIYGESHPSVADALEVLVKVYYHQYKFDKAYNEIEKALQIREKAYGKTHPLVSNSLHDFGSYYLRKGEYERAIEYFSQALKINIEVFGILHPDSIDRQVTLASAYRVSGNIVKALELLQQAEEVAKEFFKEQKHPLLARTFLELSHVHRKTGKLEQAENYVKESIRMKEEIYGREHPSLAESLQALAKLQIQRYQLAAAEDAIRSSLTMRKQAYGKQHPEVANALNEMGCLFVAMEKYPEALENQREAYNIKHEYPGEFHPELGKILTDMGTAYRHLNDFDNAMDCFQNAFNLDNKRFGSNHPFLAKIIMEMGITLKQRQSFGSAIEKLQLALAIYEKNENQDLREWTESLDTLGEIYVETGHPDKAMEHLTASLCKKNDLYISAHPAIAKTLFLEAKAYNLQGNKSQAKQKLETAMQICNESLATASAIGKDIRSALQNF